MDVEDIIKNEHIKNITNILTNIGECIEGNLLCDKTPENWVHLEPQCLAKIKNLQIMCKDKQKIIEIGVNACHSLMIMLLENLLPLTHSLEKNTFNKINTKIY
jgi:transcriptional regulator of acetoin/glycerol metabolism